ncbi:hypothetical protein Agub_g2398 [Astrephomene gubernaculifera]|uniref:Uncharacterized protein n=1 Tax=Astrephomene gubernaculifera TaxID=47775 RepID=A0AAD3DKP9_9CHLO|nr:hypothetical protein Agub_g2398 [Astrephomene gubernaculifera]
MEQPTRVPGPAPTEGNPPTPHNATDAVQKLVDNLAKSTIHDHAEAKRAYDAYALKAYRGVLKDLSSLASVEDMKNQKDLAVMVKKFQEDKWQDFCGKACRSRMELELTPGQRKSRKGLQKLYSKHKILESSPEMGKLMGARICILNNCPLDKPRSDKPFVRPLVVKVDGVEKLCPSMRYVIALQHALEGYIGLACVRLDCYPHALSAKDDVSPGQQEDADSVAEQVVKSGFCLVIATGVGQDGKPRVHATFRKAMEKVYEDNGGLKEYGQELGFEGNHMALKGGDTAALLLEHPGVLYNGELGDRVHALACAASYDYVVRALNAIRPGPPSILALYEETSRVAIEAEEPLTTDNIDKVKFTVEEQTTLRPRDGWTTTVADISVRREPNSAKSKYVKLQDCILVCDPASYRGPTSDRDGYITVGIPDCVAMAISGIFPGFTMTTGACRAGMRKGWYYTTHNMRADNVLNVTGNFEPNSSGADSLPVLDFLAKAGHLGEAKCIVRGELRMKETVRKDSGWSRGWQIGITVQSLKVEPVELSEEQRPLLPQAGYMFRGA